MSRRQPKRRAGKMATLAMAGIFIFVVVCGIGLGVASADSADDLVQSGAFGFDEITQTATSSPSLGNANTIKVNTNTVDQHVLTVTSSRDITAGLTMVDGLEVAEKACIEADNQAAINRVAGRKAMQGIEDATAQSNQIDNADEAEKDEEAIDEYHLTAVDWSVGRDAFIEEWTARINSYLEKTNLAGYGEAFAEAAWANGVDPRWSPAISNTESGNGAYCFLPHNAWGWGNKEWPDWKTAIYEHVAGLAEDYGYSITYETAQKYCPPNSVHWYNNTLTQMSLI